jgi:hypothetical protein
MHGLCNSPGNGAIGRESHDQGAFAGQKTHSPTPVAD